MRRTDPSAATVRSVRARDDHRCVRCCESDMGTPLSTHHRRNRGMGGSRWPGINLPSNLLTLCGSGTTGCHGWVTDHPREAMAAGLVVSKFADPTAMPVYTWRGWVQLTDDGEAVPVDLAPPF